MKTLSLAILLLTAVFPAYPACSGDPTCGRDLSQYVRLLIPILPTAGSAGAAGSRWQTDLWIANDAASPLDAFPFGSDCPVSVGCEETLRAFPALPAGAVLYNTFHPGTPGPAIPTGTTPGGFLYVQRSGVDQLSLASHVRDTSRGAQSFGTRIPIVPESEFFSGTHSIAAIPVNPNSRIALRIYSATTGAMHLRIEEAVGHWQLTSLTFVPPAVLVDTTLGFTYDAASDVCTLWFGCPSVQYKPATIEITDLLQRFPALTSASQTGIRIFMTSDVAYWPMVSVTSNLTNEVTLYLVK